MSPPSAGGSGTTIVLIEDHALVADALSLTLGSRGYRIRHLDPVPLARTPGAIVEQVRRIGPDLVILDLDLGPAGDAIPLIRPLVTAGQRVAVLTGSTDPARLGACLGHGAVTVVRKSDSVTALVQVLAAAAAGRPAIAPELRHRLIRLWLERERVVEDFRRRLATLTPREEEVLAALAHGKLVREVARENFVSEATVRTHVKSVLAKLGVTSQLAAAAIARDTGWLRNGR